MTSGITASLMASKEKYELKKNMNTTRLPVIQGGASRFLETLAKLHPKNQTAENIEYPQLWYCWPRWTKRVQWVHHVKTWMCGKLTGHEWSKTETGYSGRGVDHWCRWCDKMVTMPLRESPLNGEMKDMATMVLKARQGGNWTAKISKLSRMDRLKYWWAWHKYDVFHHAVTVAAICIAFAISQCVMNSLPNARAVTPGATESEPEPKL